MLNPNINIIVQCRFSSTRLPGKAMYPICGIPLLTFLIRRLKNSLQDNTHRIIVATTQNREDNPVAAWAEHENVHVIRGSQEDVLSRYILVLSSHPASINVRVTADNPLTCPEIIKSSVSLLQEKRLDYVQAQGFPHGTGVDVFSTPLLNYLHGHTSEPLDREHINNYILKNTEKFHHGALQASGALSRPDLSMTVDTPDDFKKITCIFNVQKNPMPWNMTLNQAIDNMDNLNRTGKIRHVENTPF